MLGLFDSRFLCFSLQDRRQRNAGADMAETPFQSGVRTPAQGAIPQRDNHSTAQPVRRVRSSRRLDAGVDRPAEVRKDFAAVLTRIWKIKNLLRVRVAAVPVHIPGEGGRGPTRRVSQPGFRSKPGKLTPTGFWEAWNVASVGWSALGKSERASRQLSWCFHLCPRIGSAAGRKARAPLNEAEKAGSPQRSISVLVAARRAASRRRSRGLLIPNGGALRPT